MGPWQPWLVIPAIAVFAVLAAVSRAPRCRVGLALVTGLVFAAGNLGWDLLAERAGWWSYPQLDTATAPLWLYAIAGLIFGAGVGLIGWRTIRRHGWRGAVAFLAAFTVVGVIRDCTVAHRYADVIRFGDGASPWIVDAMAWLSLAALVQATHRLG